MSDSESKAEGLSPHEAGELGEVVNELLNVLFNEAATHINQKVGADAGTKIPYSEQIKLSMAKKALQMAQRYSGQAKFDKLIDSSNAVVPCLSRIFGEKTLLEKIPPRAKDERIVMLLDKAGATELSGLIRKAMPAPRPSNVTVISAMTPPPPPPAPPAI